MLEIPRQYTGGRVVRNDPGVSSWVEYAGWREHCPHSVTLEWNRRLTVNVYERPRHFKSYTTGQIAE